MCESKARLILVFLSKQRQAMDAPSKLQSTANSQQLLAYAISYR